MQCRFLHFLLLFGHKRTSPAEKRLLNQWQENPQEFMFIEPVSMDILIICFSKENQNSPSNSTYHSHISKQWRETGPIEVFYGPPWLKSFVLTNPPFLCSHLLAHRIDTPAISSMSAPLKLKWLLTIFKMGHWHVLHIPNMGGYCLKARSDLYIL